MTKRKLFDSIDGLWAYDTGCTDSGIHDEALRQKVIERLGEPDGMSLLTEFAYKLLRSRGYSLADMKELIDWLNDRMGFHL